MLRAQFLQQLLEASMHLEAPGPGSGAEIALGIFGVLGFRGMAVDDPRMSYDLITEVDGKPQQKTVAVTPHYHYGGDDGHGGDTGDHHYYTCI